MSTAFDLLAERWSPANDYTRRPVEWIAKKTNEHLVAVQREIAESVRDNRYTAVPSCHDSGKSFLASRIICHWIDSHPPGEAFVVSTAPTAAQVSAILWREIAKAHRVAKLPGRINRAGYPQWYVGSELVGYGRKPADYEQSAFQGIHARYVLVVIDEACGVSRHLFDAVDSLATNQHARVLAIGNPDDETSYFKKICDPDSGWNVIHIDGLRTVNFTREQVANYPLTQKLMDAEKIGYNTEPVTSALRESMLSPLWVEERIKRWAGARDSDDAAAVARMCAQSNLFASKVRGIFPTNSNTGVIPLGWVQLAVNRWRDWDSAGRPMQVGRKVVGVDVAYSGDDESAVCVRIGNSVYPVERYSHADTIETANHAAKHLHTPACMAVVDVIGVGAGVYDALRRWRAKGLIEAECVPFNAAAQSHRTDTLGEFRFRNDRAAAWWNFREILDPSKGSQVMLPDDERLMEELVAPRAEHFAGGIIKIESKDEIKRRLGRSTDSADAVIQSFWVTGMAALPEGMPYAKSRPGDGAVRWDGAPMFTEADLYEQPGASPFAGSMSVMPSHSPAPGTWSGEHNGPIEWDIG